MPSSLRTLAHEGYRRVVAEAKDQGPEQVRLVMAELGRRDLFFLLCYILKVPGIDRDWLFDRCREVQAAPGRLDLWARFHYKSTIKTFGQVIQEIINNPEITICILSFNRPIAKGFLNQIKRELENNRLLYELYPEVFWADPKREAPKWSENDGIIVKRKGNPKESTIEAWGLIDGQPTSRHYKLRLYDDIVTKDTVTSPEMIKKTTDSWEASLNLTTEGGWERYAGTFWHAADTYVEIIRRDAAIPRIYAATHNGKDISEGGKAVLLGQAELVELRRKMGPYTFGCQMLMNPVADKAQGFRREWLKFWHEGRWQDYNVYILGDPASEKKKTSDYTAIDVVALGPDGNRYTVDLVRDRLNLTERWNALKTLHQKWKPLKVGWEKYGLQADIEHFEREMELASYRFDIIELGGQMPKNDRIRRLVPDFEQGRWYLPHTLTYIDREAVAHDLVLEFIDEEYISFPVSSHDDMLDVKSRIYDQNLGAEFPIASRRSSTPPPQDYDPLEGIPVYGQDYGRDDQVWS